MIKEFGVLRGGELVGRGIERHMESMLRGVDGACFVIRNSRRHHAWTLGRRALGDRP